MKKVSCLYVHMKKLLILVLIFIGSFWIFTKIHATQIASPAMQQIIPHNPSPTMPLIGDPTTLSIPSLHVYASIESVGMDTQGRMGVPQNDLDTAWYKYAAKPGQQGSAVIDGHFDTPTGAPAVFYDISKMKIGDDILVTDSYNHTYTFSVTEVTSYPYNALPMQRIFASHDAVRLNLITCDGVWSQSQHNYSNRAVIYSVLQK